MIQRSEQQRRFSASKLLGTLAWEHSTARGSLKSGMGRSTGVTSHVKGQVRGVFETKMRLNPGSYTPRELWRSRMFFDR